jgi:hypothetical protein
MPPKLPLPRAAQFVGGDDTVQWAPGESGPRSLQLRLAAAPRAGNVTARIVDGEGDAVVPAADSEADVEVLSPVLSYEPTSTVSQGRRLRACAWLGRRTQRAALGCPGCR